MKKQRFEFFVGLFMAIGILCLAFLSIRIARNELFAAGGYEVQAVFTNCNGLRDGSAIMIAGVEVGRVKAIALEDYEARVTLMLQRGVALQKDAIASIRTKGLIGEKYVEITPGAADHPRGRGPGVAGARRRDDRGQADAVRAGLSAPGVAA